MVVGAAAIAAVLLPEIRVEGAVRRVSVTAFDGVQSRALTDEHFTCGLTFTWRAVQLPLTTAMPTAPPPTVTAGEVLDAFDHEPTVQEVQLWAHRYAGADPGEVRTWLDQSRSFAALPEVTLDVEVGMDNDQGFLYLDEAGLSPIPGSVPVPVIDDADRGRSFEVGLELRWDLSALLMSTERVRMIAEARDLAALRDRVRGKVTRIYFERRRLQVEGRLEPRRDLRARVEHELSIRELTAELDALTGGEFSRALAPALPAR
jgi:hypothetical protein